MKDVTNVVENEYIMQGNRAAICIRALAFSLRIGIMEVRDKIYKWNPEFGGTQLTFNDSLNCHYENIIIYFGEGLVYLVYTNSFINNYVYVRLAYEATLKDKLGTCCKCKEVFNNMNDKVKLECGDYYHKGHLRMHLLEQTRGLFALSPGEEAKIKPRCANPYCKSPLISQSVIQTFLGDDYNTYKKQMEERTSERLVYLKCCNKDLNANKHAPYIEAIYKFNDSNPQFIPCLLNCGKPMAESDLREILGHERYNTLFKHTCGVCGNAVKYYFSIDCSHSLCVNCAKNKILPLSKEEAENPSIYYECKICPKTSKLKAIIVDKHNHSMKISDLFVKLYSYPNFSINADPGNLRIGKL